MAATIALKSCKMQIRTKTGTLTSGADAVKSISLTGIDQSAGADALLGVSDALASVISTPVIEVLRVDENLVYADE